MKNKILGNNVKRILTAIGCLILAILFWVVAKYGEIGDLPLAMMHLG